MTVAVHYLDEGPSHAPVVVLSGSIGSNLHMWEPQLEPLRSAGFRVVRYDHRGHGDSPVPRGPYAIDEVSGDLLALLDRLDIARAHVVGLSLGGMVGIWLAQHAPDRVNTLVACCTSAKPGNPAMWTDRARQVREHGTAAIADDSVARWFTEQWRTDNPERARAMRQMTANTPDEGYASCCALLEHVDLTDRLPDIAAPTLVISGADDAALPPEHGRSIADGIRGARFEVVEHAAHLGNYEQPETFNDLLLAHLS